MAKDPSRTIEKRISRVKSGSRLPSNNDSTRGSSIRANSAPPKKTSFNFNEGKNVGKIDVRVPCKNLGVKIQPKNVAPKIISKSEYEYFRARALEGLMTKEEKEGPIIEAEKEKDRLLAESMKRKEEIRIMDMKKLRDKPIKLDSIEAEARQRTMHLLERAQNLKLEQEEEIQMCNRLILETKCRAIRDAQVNEKKLMEKELNEEEKRLNEMMENERRLKLQAEARKEEEEALRKRKFAKLLRHQIIENEEQRIIEYERKREEGRLINLSNAVWQAEEIKKAKKKEEDNALMRKQLASENEKLMKFKEIEREEARIMDLRIREFQKKKDEREKALAEEQRLAKIRKDRERSQMAAKTLQASDVRAQIDELNAARIHEEVERDWRRREKEEALKRLENRRKLAEARHEQIRSRKILQAMEIERDRREFEKIVAVQKEAICREQKEREERQRQAFRHRTQILKQVNEKEREKIEARRKMFEEGIAIRAEIEMRKKKLKNAMERKCEEMRANKVPEMYINEVKNMIEKVK